MARHKTYSQTTWRRILLLLFVLGPSGIAPCSVLAGTIYASGQLLIPAVPGVHDDLRENRIFVIDTTTGNATPVSPVVSGTPAALAGAPDGRLFGFQNGSIGVVNPATAAFTPIGSSTGLNVTGLDITADGRGFVVPFTGVRQLNRIDINSGVATPVGSPTAIGASLDAHFGLAPGTSQPFIIGLGSVGPQLYGVDLETGRTNLISIDPNTGIATVIGIPDAVASANGGGYSGFAAMTGVDENGDGKFDALFGNVNFFDDNDPATPTVRLGGVARYNLTDGTWSLVGTNPGLIFFGFGSSPAHVPEPRSAVLFLIAAGIVCWFCWRKNDAASVCGSA
ncbi:MAG TPA: PEP-CTERM sorting domain-containing protein [Methylomirabilota bacterium]|nr:PEP-CTERM sorting domain-containing protein [Methylomirabilota bacterium]